MFQRTSYRQRLKIATSISGSQETNKQNFFFVRTKFDVDIDNEGKKLVVL